MKPFSPACERNREPISERLRSIIQPHHRRLLEIGSGTGQHSSYFAPIFPWLEWVTSDVRENHAGIRAWRDAENISGPIEYEVGVNRFPKGSFDLVYIANVFHIMAWEKVKILIQEIGSSQSKTELLIYGPFNYEGRFTSASNEEFDAHLRSVDPLRGIRNFEDVRDELRSSQFWLVSDVAMPANNRFLHFANWSL